jgi:hypothetical protein
MSDIMSPVNRSGARLSPCHEEVLLVALGPREHRIGRWAQLRDRHELWEPATRQLLPVLAASLVDVGIDDPDVHRLEQVRSEAWLGNQLVFHRIGGALDVLAAAGVRTMALKGVPLALRHYDDLSLRPMGDFDLLVDADAASAAVEALREAGWTFEWVLHPDFVARTYEIPCRPPDGTGILDLHWRLLPWVGRRADAPDPALWEAATPLTVGAHLTLGPAPHDLLLNVIQHAYKSGWWEVPRWVADVVVLLRSAEETLDWDAFVDRTARTALALPVGDALSYVAATFDAAVPEPVLGALGRYRPSRRELRKHRRAEEHITNKPHRFLGGAENLRTGWARGSINFTRVGAVRSAGPYLRGRMHVERLWTLPFVVAARRLRRASRARAQAR